jgi:hypothetical protein
VEQKIEILIFMPKINPKPSHNKREKRLSQYCLSLTQESLRSTLYVNQTDAVLQKRTKLKNLFKSRVVGSHQQAYLTNVTVGELHQQHHL